MRRATLILLFLLLLGALFSSCKKEEHPIEALSKTAEQKDIVYWTCGMHPSVRSDKPGKCPICNMDLVPVTAEDTEALHIEPESLEMVGAQHSEIRYLPLVKTISTLKSSKIMMMGSSQNFFRTFRKPQRSFRNSMNTPSLIGPGQVLGHKRVDPGLEHR